MVTFRGVINKRAKKIWESKLPMKLKAFVWQVQQNRLPTKEVLQGRKWKRERPCNL